MTNYYVSQRSIDLIEKLGWTSVVIGTTAKGEGPHVILSAIAPASRAPMVPPLPAKPAEERFKDIWSILSEQERDNLRKFIEPKVPVSETTDPLLAAVLVTSAMEIRQLKKELKLLHRDFDVVSKSLEFVTKDRDQARRMVAGRPSTHNAVYAKIRDKQRARRAKHASSNSK